MKISKTMAMASGIAMSMLMTGTAIAGDANFDYGNFEGYTLRVKLIGGAQYEPLYATISE